MKDYLIRKYNKTPPIAVIDGTKVLGRDIDEENHTVYVIEKNGEKSVVLYNQIDQRKIQKKDFIESDVTISKRTKDGLESIKLKNYDEQGDYVFIDIGLEREKFISHEKYAKKDTEA